MILGVLGSSAFAFGLLAAVATKVPQLDPNKQHTQANTYVYASDGHTILTILRGSQARIVVPSTGISPWMKHAIVAVEDKRFYEHRGVDVRGMARALWADVTHHGAVQGGSTITQQFVKNAYLTSKKSIGRKLFEAALAWQLEQKWTKDQILTAYLNTIYLGNHAYGVEQASRVYFKHSAKTLTPAEAALLAAIPEDPSLYDPVAHPAAAKARRNLVLRDLYQQQYLTHDQLLAALNAPMPDPRGIELPAIQAQGNAAPYFANYVADQLVRKYGPGTAFGGGLRVRTTLNVGLQLLARKAIISTLPSFSTGDGPSAALVALDARTGRGARDGRRPQLPQEPVQPGDAGTAPARLVVQAVRPRGRARAAHRAVEHPRLETRDDRRGRAALAGEELRGRLPRADQPGHRRSPSPTTRSSPS